MTARLFFDDPYLVEFEASVVRREARGGRPALVLDRTAFYPESGGQPADRGTINGVKVVDVQEDGGEIRHAVETDVPGDRVRGKIDWALRFDRMQQHSGQHILSQAFIETLNGETRSFHLGDEVSTLEIGLGRIDEPGLERVERAANAVVFENREVKTYFVPEDKIAEVPLRRPPKKEGTIRIVEVAGFDYSACGGTHVRRTGEVGLIKVSRWEKIRGNLRFDFLCGGRALAEYIQNNKNMRRLGSLFSVGDKDVPSTVDKTLAEWKAQKKAARAMQETLAGFEARALIDKEPGKIIRRVFTDKTPEEAKLLALKIIRQASRVVLFAVQAQPQSHIIMARSDDLTIDLRPFASIVSSIVTGKGGGGPSLVEIDTLDQARLDEALLKVEESLPQGN
ncbi:MAG: alanine--tRNA ligase-related protein [Candidatus Aminicenantes bacterium]|nr:alanine--tRNA ligase-related protein [Candidatus Aminicenantes bacterium]